MEEILFYDTEHASIYSQISSKMKEWDCYHQTVAYLISLDKACRSHIEDLFDFEHDNMLPSGLYAEWQCEASRKTMRLALNLWYGYIDEETERNTTPVDIFDSDLAVFYFEAIKLRFPQRFS